MIADIECVRENCPSLRAEMETFVVRELRMSWVWYRCLVCSAEWESRIR